MADRGRASEREELAAFLRSRRERLTPAAVGLPTTARRRTPGLRREEVAQIAGVGVTWYTWLEQGRNIQVSPYFLEQIARALRFDATERAHLFMLAHNRPPPLTSTATSSVTPALQRLLDTVEAPAYLATANLDVVAWNAVLSAVFGDFDALAPAERNMLWLVFASAQHRRTIPNWENEARGMLARFRVEFGRRRDDPAFLDLIERLQRASHEFHRWWSEHDVTRRGETTKSFNGPFGRMSMEQTAFAVEEAPDRLHAGRRGDARHRAQAQAQLACKAAPVAFEAQQGQVKALVTDRVTRRHQRLRLLRHAAIGATLCVINVTRDAREKPLRAF